MGAKTVESVNRMQLLLLLAAGLALAACSEQQPEKAEYYVFGTLVEVSLAGTDPATAQFAFQELQQLFQYMHRDWHAWEPGQLGEINQAIANGQNAIADPHIAELIRRSGQMETASGGRFNAAIGKLIALWGFHTSDYPIQAAIPDEHQIAQLVTTHPSVLDIGLKELGDQLWQVSSDNPGVQLDFGGIAKGYAVDLAIELLGNRGIGNAIVNAGGDLRAIGSNQGHAWRVAIQNPLGGIIGIIEVDSGEAVFTSGNYQRFGEDENGFRYAHILDPATGWPVNHVMSATVITRSGINGDAAATALVVAGLKDWPELVTGMGLEQFLLTDEQGTVYITRTLHSRLELNAGNRLKVVLLD
jgi:thiamine biosynthesis lipoprotein